MNVHSVRFRWQYGLCVPSLPAAHPLVARPRAVPEPAAGVRAARGAGGRVAAERDGHRGARREVGGRDDTEEPGGPREARGRAEDVQQ